MGTAWLYAVWTYDGATVTTYSNGKAVGTNTITPATDNGRVLDFVGSGNFVGMYDEVRLADGVRSADWVKASYDTVATEGFAVAGNVIDLSAFDKLTVAGALGKDDASLSPTVGTRSVADGETVPFTAPSAEQVQTDGTVLFYAGYRLYVTDADMNETLVADETALSGFYTHVAGTFARIVWKQVLRKGGRTFDTKYASLISVPGYVADETLVNFPVLVKIAAGHPEGFSYADVQTGGTDILFTTAEGVTIPHEIEKWDPDGTSYIWVNLPKLSAGTMFRFCYGNADVTTAPDSQTNGDVWADAGFAGVWHMNESAAEAAADATANHNGATPTGADATQCVGTAGAVGGARVVASTAIVNKFEAPHHAAYNLGDAFAASLWLKASVVNGNGRIFCKKAGWSDANGWETQFNSATQVTPRGSSADDNRQTVSSLTSDTWRHLMFIYNGNVATTYLDGVKVGDSAIAPVVDNKQSLRFLGDKAYKGAVDEVRLLSAVPTAARVKADYDTVTSDGFLSLGKVVSTGDANTLLVESADTERGTVTPPWGKTTGLAAGNVAFSAPSGTQPTEDETLGFKFTGYALFVTSEGVERLVLVTNALSGVYAHVDGQSARLVWSTVDMPRVKAEASAGGQVTGAGYYALGDTVTLTALPEAGYRFIGWSGDLPEDVNPTDLTIAFVSDKARAVTASFAEKTVTTAFFSWKGHAEGETVTTENAGNDLGTTTFSATSVNVRGKNGALPAFSRQHPGSVVYTDALCTEILTTDPGSLYFTSATRPIDRGAGGDVEYASLGTWISQQKSCTIEFFCRAEVYLQYSAAMSMNLSGDQEVVYAPDANDYQTRYAIEATVTGSKGSATSSTAATGATANLADAWQHIALVYDRDNQKVTFYRNYALVGDKATVITETSDPVACYFGSGYGRNSDIGHNFNGWISCLRVTKGALIPSEFLRAKVPATADGTVVFYDFRGEAGSAVDGVTPCIGDGGAFRAKGAPVRGTTRPDEAIYANAAAVAACKPLTKKVGSVAFDGTASLMLTDVSTALSQCENYTLEFFEKCGTTVAWKSAISWNDTAQLATAKGSQIQIPGQTSKTLTLQYKPTGSAHCLRTTEMKDEAWHHVALVYAKATDTATLYYDRQSVGSIVVGGKRLFTAGPLLLGSEIGNEVTERFMGEITGLRLTNRALATDEFLVAAPKPVTGLLLIVR